MAGKRVEGNQAERCLNLEVLSVDPGMPRGLREVLRRERDACPRIQPDRRSRVGVASGLRPHLHPFEGADRLLFAGWPMLEACYARYSLRESDALGSLL